MRILVLSPHFPPTRGGVSDHTAIVSKAFSDLGNEIKVLTDQELPVSIEKIETHQIQVCFKGVGSILYETKRFKPDLVLIQFTPLAFAEKFYGIALWLPLLILRLKKGTQAVVAIYAHETGFPMSFTRKGLLLGVPHFFQFFLMASFADRVFFSHIANWAFWAKSMFWRKKLFSIVSTFSNIKVSGSHSGIRNRWNIPVESEVLFYFGGAHDMNLLDFVFEAFAFVNAKFPARKAVLCLAGVTERNLLKKGITVASENIKVLGFLEQDEISEFYREARMVLAPFGEGLNSRRGSAMAAFAHGKAVVSTNGWCTREDHPWGEFACLTPSNNSKQYAERAVALFSNDEEIGRLGRAAAKYYAKYFSTDVAVEKILAEVLGAQKQKPTS